MKTSKKFTSAVLVILTSALLSWNDISDSKKEVNVFGYTYLYNNKELNNDDLYALIENKEQYLPDKNQVPAAQDVVIQKIPGDNNHLLMMAFYSKENYSGPFLTLQDGFGIVFRDDGKGFDKKAGDGFYTARVAADVREFRKQAVLMDHQMVL